MSSPCMGALGVYLEELFCGDSRFEVSVCGESISVFCWAGGDGEFLRRGEFGERGRYLLVLRAFEDECGFHAVSSWGTGMGLLREPGLCGEWVSVGGVMKFVFDFEWADPGCLSKLERVVSYYGMRSGPG